MKPAKSGERRASAPARAASERAGLAVRRMALEILLGVQHRSAFADVLLGHRIGVFAPPDRRLLTRLVLGTIAWRGRLDYEIAALYSRKLAQLNSAVLMILRLGLFQMRFVSRIPKHAAVDTSVSLARENPAARAASGFVNAILRRASGGPLPLPERTQDEVGYLTVAYSHPRWMVEKFIEWFGVETAETLMAGNNEAAPNAIRLNLSRGSRETIIEELSSEGFRFASGGRLPETAIVEGAPQFDSAAQARGLFYAQSEASQLVARMLDPRPGATVIDCAAAPGGKATHLAELVGERGRVIALDVSFAGLKKVRALATRLGDRDVAVVRADLTAGTPIRPASCDFVLLDAPCTGLGTLREHPEIRWRLKLGDSARMAALQSRMLAGAASLVGPGGVIVYAVCSLAPEEGGEVVRDFLERHPEFAIDRNPPIRKFIEEAFDDQGMLLTRPDRDGLDGFFAARLARR
jgi:16S rRNA (cytosine967-C5)-methyltransferase